MFWFAFLKFQIFTSEIFKWRFFQKDFVQLDFRCCEKFVAASKNVYFRFSFSLFYFIYNILFDA